jgi:hypothetical protein
MVHPSSAGASRVATDAEVESSESRVESAEGTAGAEATAEAETDATGCPLSTLDSRLLTASAAIKTSALVNASANARTYAHAPCGGTGIWNICWYNCPST